MKATILKDEVMLENSKDCTLIYDTALIMDGQ